MGTEISQKTMKRAKYMHLSTHSLKFKIIFFTAACVLVVGVACNLLLYRYMNGIIMEKAENINTIYLNNIEEQLNTNLQAVHDLANLCSNDVDVADMLEKTNIDSPADGRAALRIQKLLGTYLQSNGMERYVQRLIVFNESGVSVHASTSASGNIDDVQKIMQTPLYQQRNYSPARFSNVYTSIVPSDGDCLAALYAVDNPGVPIQNGYLYIEIKLSVLTDVLAPYAKINDIFVSTNDGRCISVPGQKSFSDAQKMDIRSLAPEKTIRIDGGDYQIYKRTLNAASLTIHNCVNVSSLDFDSQKVSYTVFITIVTSLLVSLGILVIFSNYITRPIQTLITRIKKISNDNDFSYDPEIERSADEIGAIGRVVNEMSGSIQNLLNETIEAGDERKNIEIALLQSQVNPHFLYNTLDSIHWMAVIQKNPGISSVTHSLVNLLKNMAKGLSSKITLEEELSLLNDYATIQSIRYLETFEIVNKIDRRYYRYTIIKMTLQPIVENAIFHGIEPTGVYGTITLDAYEDEQYLYITIHDNGIGMTGEEIEALMARTRQETKNTMNGIGVANVDRRLKLIYGKDCGLTIESVKGEYTLVTVKIRKETENNEQDTAGR